MMVGSAWTSDALIDPADRWRGGRQDAETGARLRVVDLSAPSAGEGPDLADISFEVKAGEILGVAGVSGNGQQELAEVLFGTRHPQSGSVLVDGIELAGASPSRVVEAGVGRIPEDRDAGVIGEMSVAYNLALEHLSSFRRGPTLDEPGLRAHAEELIGRFAIKARPTDRLRTLSGGNVQKVLLARVLARQPKVLIAAQPTRGLDVGATEFVRFSLAAERDRGAAVLLISEDLEEILRLSDRIVVMYEGRIVGEMDAASADLERLGLMMGGSGEGA